MAVHRVFVLLFVLVVPQLVVEGCWPSQPSGRPMSRCEKERADGSAHGVLPNKAFVKQCEADGSYSTVQCGGSRRFCYCAHPETGVIFTETRTRGQPRNCDNFHILRDASPCDKQMYSENPAMLPGGFIKECEADGSFRKEQCDPDGMCFCVNTETGELYGQTGVQGHIDCDEYEAMVGAETGQVMATPCQKQKFSLSPAMLPGGFIKECEADGSFRKEQCDPDRMCYCVNTETGELYGQTGVQGHIDCDEYEAMVGAETGQARATPCQKQKFSLSPEMLPGGFIKECEADGSFRKEQCDPDRMCYCVNTETGELYGQTGVQGHIDCDEYEAMVGADADERTACEKQRDADNPATLPGGFIKECEADGSFRKEQCDPDGLCFCVNTETGELYTHFNGTQGQINCDEYEAMVGTGTDQDELTACEKQKDSDNPAMLPGGFIKECEADGSFRKEQCDPDRMCFCVNTETGELYGQSGVQGHIDCDEYEAMVGAETDQDDRTPCEKQKDSDNPTMLPGGFIKECEADGSFRKEQCDPDRMCYCVNTETGELYQQTGMRGPLNCEEYEAMHEAGINWSRG